MLAAGASHEDIVAVSDPSPESRVAFSPEARTSARRWGRPAIAACVVALVVAAAIGGALWRHVRPAARFARALAALDARRFDDVARQLEHLRGAPEYGPHVHFLQGALLIQAEQYAAALEEFGYCVDEPELRVRTLGLSGGALSQIRRYRSAFALLQKALDADPDAVDAHRGLAGAYYDLGLIHQSMEHLRRVAELDPTDPRPHRLMGLIQKDNEQYAGAVDSYRESLRRDAKPSAPDTRGLELAECLIKLQRFDEAIEALSAVPPGPDRGVKEAECHYSGGRPADSKRLVNEALAQSPAHLDGLVLKSSLATDEGDIAGAVDALSMAVAAYPKEYVPRFKLAAAYRRFGDESRANEHSAKAEALKALRLEFSRLHQVAAGEPDNADVRCRLGVLASELDRPRLASVWFSAALGINPRHEETLRRLGVVPVKMQVPPAPSTPRNP
jgi:tetratricopeptide (TPR) repeat protein